MTVSAGLAGGFAADLLRVVSTGVFAGPAAVFEAVTPVAEGLGAIVFRATVGLDAAGSVVDLAGLLEPVAGLPAWRWGVLLFGLSDSLFLMISSMISKN